MSSPTDPKQRLTDAIAAAYAPYGGTVAGETLLLPDGERPLQALFRYLELVARSREFTYLPPLFGPGEGLPMAGMYVELAVSNSRAAPMPGLLGASLTLAAAQEQRRLQQLAQRLNADDALGSGRQHNMVVLGDPGGGKTSLLKRATARIASGLWPAWIVPLYIPLRRYWESRRRFPNTGLTLLRHAALRIVEVGQQPFLSDYGTASTLHPKLAAPEILADVDAMESLLSQISGVKKQHVLFLLDGLDEIASDPEAVEVLGDEIRHLAYGFSWVVASRRAGFFGGLEEDIRYEVLSLDNDGIEQLVRNWFRHQEQAPASAGDRVLSQVAGNPRLLAMARNPFLLTLLCHLQAAEIGDLPLYRSAVYERIFKLAREQLQHREKDKTRFGLAELEFLSGFCRHLYTDAPRAPRHLFDRDDWVAFADKTPAPDLERHFLASRLLDRWGEGDDYHLAHLTLHEYLVARNLADAPVGTAIGRAYSPHWRMVLRFLAGLYRERSREEELGGLIRSLLAPVDLNGLLYIEAAQLLLEADIEDSTALLGYDLRENLWQLWREQTDYVAEAAGRALATLAPALALARIRALLDAQQGRINLMAAPSNPGRLALAGVDLLADIPLDAAGDLLVSLLCDDARPELADAAVHALVRRNWPTVRRAVLACAATASSETFKRICHIASFSRHADFAPWLLASLQASAEPTHELVEASALVGGRELEAALLEQLRGTPWRLADFPPSTLEGVLSISSEWQAWVMANAADDLTHRALAVRHHLIDEAKTLEWLATAQGSDLEELIVAAGEGASVPRAVEDALLACLSGSAAVRSQVVYALLRIDNERHGRDAPPRHRELFAQLLDDPESEVRELALAALGNLGDARRLDRMLELAGDPKQPLIVRCASIEALGKLPSDPEITDHLEVWLADPSEQIGQAAALTLARTGPGRLAAHLASGRVRAALAQVGAEQGLLFFESFYVDAGGKRHPWKAESRPAINPARHSGPYFVSYNSRDIGIVRELVLQLEAAGFDVLWDQADLPRVGLWQQELYDLIQRAAGAIILCGPHGPGDWQKEEMFACVNRAKKATDFSLRSVFLPGMTIKPFASFLLDNYDQLDLRDGLRVEKLVQRLAGPRPQIQRSIPSSKLHAQYAPWPDAEENKPAIPAFGSLQAPPKAWQEMDGLARQRAHLQSHLDDPKTCARWSLDALDAGSREALELIHSAALLRRADYLAALWHRPWSPLVADLVKRGLLHEQDHFLKIEEHVAACLEKDEKTLLARQQQWIERLRPLSEHWDIALELCLQFVNTGAYPELIELAHHHVFAVEEAWVRKLFGQTLDSLAAKKSIWNRLPTRERLLLLDAQGVCKLKEGNAEAAHELFVRMARIASRTKDAWGLAEAWLHQGLTWYARQDDDRAAQCYRRSAEHAGEADDDLLRGRALHNLAQCLIERDPEQAAAVLEESVVCKQRAGDSLFATHHAHGLLAVQGGHLAEALRCFRRAERLARKSGNRDELAKVLHNQGNVLAALGRHDEAWKTGEEAYALAQKLQAPETLILTTRGLAVRCHQAGDGERASGLFQELAQLLNDSEDIAGSVVALSDAGASQFQRNDPQAARHLFDQAIELARSSGKVDGLVRVFRNYSVTFGGTTEAGLAWLEQTGEEATRRGEWCVLAELAAIEAGWRDREGAAPATIRACWDRAAAAAVHCRDWPHHLHILQQRYTWLRDHLGHKSAQAALEDLAKRLARRRGCESDYVAALSEWGNALQECGDHDQARRRYRQALRILQCHEDRELQTDLLNNLGESLRKTGEIDEAIACYQQALELTAGDAWEERLRIEHNLALAESESDSPDAGEKRLTRIRDLAKKRRLWTAQANACLALAHLSWEKPSQALRRYVSAIEVATRHDLTDIRLNAELNRARLLLTQDRAAEAASILGPLETHFAGHEFGLELHLELAEAHRQCGQASAALATLRNASNCLVEQPDRLADWHTALAQTLFMNGQAEDAWSTMNQALTLDCTTNRRADLLVDAAHLAVSLYRDCGDAPSSHVQTVIDLAHAETSWMPDQRRHFWNSLGEAFWQAGIHDDGAMCFLKAMIEDGTGEDLAAYGADGILLFHRLRELGEPRTQLLQQTKEWLMSQGITNDATLEQLLWPFSMADEVGTASLEQAALERMLVSVWQRIFPSTK